MVTEVNPRMKISVLLIVSFSFFLAGPSVAAQPTHCPGADHLDNKGNNLVHLAVLNNQIEMLELLIGCGIPLDALNFAGHTPAHVAVSQRNATMVRVLHDGGADLNTLDFKGLTIFHHAIHHENLDMAQLLFDLDLDIDAADNQKNTALHLAVDQGNILAITWLAEHYAELNLKNSNGHVPLHLAVYQHEHPEVLHTLLDAKADTEIGDKWGLTPLHHGAVHNFTEFVKMKQAGQHFILRPRMMKQLSWNCLSNTVPV